MVLDNLLKARIAFLCSFMKAGSPHITPTWVDIKNGNIIVKTAIGRIKHKNVWDSIVDLSIIDQVTSKMVTVWDSIVDLSIIDQVTSEMVTDRGKVIEQNTGEAAEQNINKLYKKYT